MWIWRVNWNSLHFLTTCVCVCLCRLPRTQRHHYSCSCFLSITAPFSRLAHCSWLFLFLLDFLSITCTAITTRTWPSHLFSRVPFPLSLSLYITVTTVSRKAIACRGCLCTYLLLSLARSPSASSHSSSSPVHLLHQSTWLNVTWTRHHDIKLFQFVLYLSSFPFYLLLIHHHTLYLSRWKQWIWRMMKKRNSLHRVFDCFVICGWKKSCLEIFIFFFSPLFSLLDIYNQVTCVWTISSLSFSSYIASEITFFLFSSSSSLPCLSLAFILSPLSTF